MNTTPVARLQRELGKLDALGLRRRRRTTHSPCAPWVNVDGRRLLGFNSNDYLGLAADPRIADALREGVARYGAGSGASHLVSGHSLAHARLEERLAEFLAPHLVQARALSFSTGYMANLAALGALAAPDPGATEIFSDSLNHASIIDGARLSRARVTVYPHGDAMALESLLTASPADTRLVVTDTVFSMDGDLAPLPALVALCERYGAWLIADDAHGFGVLGESGRGALEHFALRSEHLVVMGTLGKAAGVSGAFIAAHESVIEWLVQRARPYIYTTAAAPALAHALLTSIDLIAGEEGRVRRRQLGALRTRLAALPVRPGWRRLASETAIQPLVIGGNADAVAVAQALEDRGLWIPAIRTPTVPDGTARLRIALSAAHTDADVAALIAAMGDLVRGT